MSSHESVMVVTLFVLRSQGEILDPRVPHTSSDAF